MWTRVFVPTSSQCWYYTEIGKRGAGQSDRKYRQRRGVFSLLRGKLVAPEHPFNKHSLQCYTHSERAVSERSSTLPQLYFRHTSIFFHVMYEEIYTMFSDWFLIIRCNIINTMPAIHIHNLFSICHHIIFPVQFYHALFGGGVTRPLYAG